jgi:hypothetical protein
MHIVIVVGVFPPKSEADCCDGVRIGTELVTVRTRNDSDMPLS